MNAPLLSTDRLILREIERNDFDAVFRFMGNPAVTAHIGDGWATRTSAWQRFCQARGLWSLVGHGYWAICWRTSGQLIGLGGLGSFEREMPELEGYPEAGYAFAPEAWGKGVASEALAAFVRWSDATLPSDEVRCIISEANTASIRVAEKCGFSRFGAQAREMGKSLFFKRQRWAEES